MLCIRIGLPQSSNMLHYSNACSREKSRRYLVIRGGLAWKLCCTRRRVVGDVVVLSHTNVGLGVYRRRRGGRNNKYKAIVASQNITRQCAVLGVT